MSKYRSIVNGSVEFIFIMAMDKDSTRADKDDTEVVQLVSNEINGGAQMDKPSKH
jgi:hypothetical protein